MASNEFDRERERKRRAADAPADARRVQTPPAEPVVVGRRPAVATRRRSPVTWLLPLLLLLALIPLFRRNRNASDDQTATRGDTMTSTLATSAGDVANAGAVARFASWANQASGAQATESEANHPYTAEGIRYLADALQEVATRPGASAAAGPAGATGGARGAANTGYTDRIQRIRDRAAQIEQASPNDNHAEHANAAFTDAARLIGELRGGQAAGTRGSGDLMNAARAVRPGQGLSPQGTQVRTFFQRSATALQGLSAGTGAGTTGQGAGTAGTGSDSARRR
ncbi:MAG TPA: hypothetical protein VNA89_01285 [Gemmatimonadaceae bacterium]|nr:hypothetical protein [Gemmatimonadaceae bacterium]